MVAENPCRDNRRRPNQCATTVQRWQETNPTDDEHVHDARGGATTALLFRSEFNFCGTAMV